MIIVKVLQSFLLPSTFLLLFIVVGLVLLLSQKRKKCGKVLIVLGILFYFLFSTTPISDFALTPLEEKYRPLSLDDVAKSNKTVLLLGGRESNVLRGSEVLRIWHLSEEPMKIIISGTDPLIQASEEAIAVRNFFIHRGILPSDITIEGKSRNTRENVMNVKKIVGEKDFFLVTSAYHMERSIREFERLGANPIPAPTDFKRKRGSSYHFLDFLPNPQNLRKSDLAFHEYFGAAYYRIIPLFASEN